MAAPPPPPTPTRRYIALEGNIGAGKTTLIDGMSVLRPGWELLREPVDLWGEALCAFYAEPRNNSFFFQMEILRTRVQQLQEAASPPHVLPLTERCVQSSSHVFVRSLVQAGLMSPAEHAAYTRWFEFVDAHVLRHHLAGIVYIDTPAEVCLMRSRLRAREGETSIPLDYIQHIGRTYASWLEQAEAEGVPVIRIDGSMRPEEIVAEGIRAIERLRDVVA